MKIEVIHRDTPVDQATLILTGEELVALQAMIRNPFYTPMPPMPMSWPPREDRIRAKVMATILAIK